MKIIYSILFFFLSSLIYSQQDVLWEKVLGGINGDYIFDAISTSDYGFIIAGSSFSNKSGDIDNTFGDLDFVIIKFNESGEKEWVKSFGGKRDDILKNIIKTNDGGFLLLGNSDSDISGNKISDNLGQSDIWLIKINVFGEIEWQKSLGGLGNDEATKVIMSKDNGFLILGTSESDSFSLNIGEDEISKQNDYIFKSVDSFGNKDVWLIKIDKNGEEIWQKSFGGSFVDQSSSLIELNDESLIISANSNSPISVIKDVDVIGNNDWWMIALSKEGDVIWQKVLGTDTDDFTSVLVKTFDDNFIVGGSFGNVENNKYDSDLKILKYNIKGEILWQNSYDIGRFDILNNIFEDKDGSFILSGYSKFIKDKEKSKKNEKGIQDFIIIKTDSEGQENEKKIIGSKQNEVLVTSIVTRDRGLLLLGNSIPTTKTNLYDSNFYILKLLDKDKNKVNKDLIEAMPNPAIEYTSIVLGFDYTEGNASLIDLNGRILNEFAINGNRTINFDLRKFPEGFYVVNIKTDKGDASIKIAKFNY